MEIREMINKIMHIHESLITVYRYLDNDYNPDYSPIEYFAVNKKYASNFGDYENKFLINTNNSKILNLEYWNKLYKDKTGINGNKYNKVQGIFVIGEKSIDSNYEEPLSRFSLVFPKEIVNKFINEFNECDAIYGEDAGYPNEFVFAVKNKKIIKKI
jgi:hypothetical protein